MGRLIDADALIEAINKSTCNWAEYMWKKVVYDVISNQPTAYNIENVVAELEKESVETDGFLMIHTEGAVDIVKMGGINN